MNTRQIILMAFVGMQAAHAQTGPAQDPAIAELRDSLRLLVQELNALRVELATRALLIQRRFIRRGGGRSMTAPLVQFELNKLARARVTVESADGSQKIVFPAEDHRDKHTVRVGPLLPQTTYTVTIEVLKH